MSLLYPENGKEGKTERGTEKKRRDARKDGKVVCSQEIVTALVLSACTWALLFIMPYLQWAMTEFLQNWHRVDITAEWTTGLVQRVFLDVFWVWAFGALLIGGVAVASATVASVAQTKPFYSPELLKWKFDSLNPAKGFKQLFSKDSLVKLALSLLKVSIVTLVVWGIVRRHIPELVSLHRLDLSDGVRWYTDLFVKVIWWVLTLYIIIAVIDWIKEKRKFEFNIMMSRQEVKDEHKNQEGSPHVKRQMRKKMQELSLSRMMAAVPDASVVIVNPIHLAIAIKYDAASSAAPVVVAKGKRLTALRIRAVAEKNGVPILERKPLAWAMYAKVKIGRPIPVAFYGAVAELLAYLYRIGNERVRSQLIR